MVIIMKIQLTHSFEDIICLENLLLAWKEFEKGKKQKKDVQIFQIKLMDNIFSLHHELLHHTYKHGGYQAFKINDPKPRDIHKAKVRDRLLHHAIYRKLYPFFDKTFISDSYSCRNNKGTHKAINNFRKYFQKVSQNNTKTCWVLKCDIRKFFANIDHQILKNILAEYISDKDILWLLETELKLKLHPNKVFIKTFSSGVDFLGMVNFPKHKILRAKTKRRMFKKISQKHKLLREDLISQNSFDQSLQSYLGILKHCNGYKTRKEIEKYVFSSL